MLWGGWTTNTLWCAQLFVRNRSGRQFAGVPGLSGSHFALNYALAASAGLLWYGQFFFYSMGQARMGPYDFSSWTLHMAGTILFATLWGVTLHEWRGSSARTKLIGSTGFLLLLVSTVIVGYGSYLKSR